MAMSLDRRRIGKHLVEASLAMATQQPFSLLVHSSSGDPYAFTKTPSSIMWEHLPHEFVVGRLSKKNKPQISSMAHAQCALLGFNAYKILIELLSTVVEMDVEREYMCTRHTANDNQDDELTCPMMYVYMICDNLIKAKAKGWKTSSGYKKHRDFL